MHGDGVNDERSLLGPAFLWAKREQACSRGATKLRGGVATTKLVLWHLEKGGAGAAAASSKPCSGRLHLPLCLGFVADSYQQWSWGVEGDLENREKRSGVILRCLLGSLVSYRLLANACSMLEA